MTEDYVAAYVTVGAGLVLLVVLILAVLPALRRFARASATLRSGMAAGTAPLQALMNPRKPRDE